LSDLIRPQVLQTMFGFFSFWIARIATKMVLLPSAAVPKQDATVGTVKDVDKDKVVSVVSDGVSVVACLVLW